MSGEYVVTCEDGYFEHRYPSAFVSGEEWAVDAEDAAQMWGELNHAYFEYTKEMVALVTRPDGSRCKVTVYVEMVPSFSASDVEEVEDGG